MDKIVDKIEFVLSPETDENFKEALEALRKRTGWKVVGISREKKTVDDHEVSVGIIEIELE